jgi:hypothetical protein
MSHRFRFIMLILAIGLSLSWHATAQTTGSAGSNSQGVETATLPDDAGNHADTAPEAASRQPPSPAMGAPLPDIHIGTVNNEELGRRIHSPMLVINGKAKATDRDERARTSSKLVTNFQSF